MNIVLILCGNLETTSGGFLYDRQLVSKLRLGGDRVDVVSLPPGGYGRQLAGNLSFRLSAGPDIVLQDELAHPALILANTRQRAVPVVSIVHNLRLSVRRRAWEGPIYRVVERKYLESVNGFVFNSSATRKSVEALVTKQNPYVIAPPGGDRLGEASVDHIESRSLGRGPLRLIFLANVTQGKGLEVLLDALARLPRNEYVLDVVGSCEIEARHANAMRRKALDLGLAAAFHGVIDNHPLQEKLEKAQIMVLPSFYEGFGIAYLEGMAQGLPAIGTTAGGIPEVVTHGVDGYLIRPGDSMALAGHLRALASDRALLSRLSVSALRSFQAKPTWGQSTQIIRNFLMGMIGEQRSVRT
jgi:glycosyltransferase involved in cell wall biosynthesis